MRALLFDGAPVEIDARALVMGGSWYSAQGAPPMCDHHEGLHWIHTRAQALDAPILLDVGASTGSYALLAAHHPGMRVWAFEPNVYAFRVLAAHVSLNGLQSRAHITPVALTDTNGRVTLKVPRDRHEWGLATIGAPGRFAHWHEYTVRAETLDHAVARLDIPRVDLLKIDTEGAELLVLRGGEKTIRRDHPALLLEFNGGNMAQFNYTPSELTALLDAWGAHYAMVDGEDLGVWWT